MVVADLASWQSLIDLGAALREQGFEVIRYTTRPGGAAQRARVALERVVFDQTRLRLGWRPPGVVDLADLPQILPTVVDVQSVDRVGSALLATPQWQAIPRLRRVHAPGVQETDIYDKYVYSRIAEAAGVTIPETWIDPSDLPPGTGLVVKVRVGSGGEGVSLVSGAHEVPAALRALGLAPSEVLVQRRVFGQLWNVGGVAYRGSVLAAASYLVAAPDSDPEGPPTLMQIEENSVLLSATARLVGALGYSGPFALDFMVDDHAYFLDFNPRFFGGWAIMQASGTDLLGAYISMLEGRAKPARRAVSPSNPLPCAFGGGEGLRGRLSHNRRVREIAGPVLGRRWRGLAWVESLAAARSTP